MLERRLTATKHRQYFNEKIIDNNLAWREKIGAPSRDPAITTVVNAFYSYEKVYNNYANISRYWARIERIRVP